MLCYLLLILLLRWIAVCCVVAVLLAVLRVTVLGWLYHLFWAVARKGFVP